MSNQARERIEKSDLLRQIALCERYLSYIESNKDCYTIETFARYTKIYLEKINKLREKIDHLEGQKKKKGIAISAIAILFIIAISFIAFNPEHTGNAIFSITKTSSLTDEMIFNESASFVINSSEIGRLNTIALSGKFEGEGELRIYLNSENGRKLIYGTFGSSDFNGECGSACYISEPDKYHNISIEMGKGDHLRISKIDYMISELSQFEISPKNITVELKENRHVSGKISIYNSRRQNFSIAIFAEGEIAKYTTLYSSQEHFFSNESSKEIRYDIEMPYKIEAGKHSGKILVKYLPDGKFTGEVPTEEHTIMVNVKPMENEMRSEKKFGFKYLVVGLLVLVFIGNVFFFYRMRKK